MQFSLLITGKQLCTASATHPMEVHRGVSDSKFSVRGGDGEITLEEMARDLLAVINCLKWKELALCGFSMGGEMLGSSPLFN